MNKEIINCINEYERKSQTIAIYEEQIRNIKLEIDKKIEALEDQIAYFQKKYEKLSRPINDKIDNEISALDKFALNNIVKINLSDIVNAITDITKENAENLQIYGYHTPFIYTKINNVTSKQNIVDYINQPGKDSTIVSLYIEGTYHSKPYKIKISYETNLSDCQADGKTLLEHSDIKDNKNEVLPNNQNHIINSIPFSQDDLKSLVCHFNLKQIIDFQKNTDLLSKAVIKCLNTSKIKVKQKSLNHK